LFLKVLPTDSQCRGQGFDPPHLHHLFSSTYTRKCFFFVGEWDDFGTILFFPGLYRLRAEFFLRLFGAEHFRRRRFSQLLILYSSIPFSAALSIPDKSVAPKSDNIFLNFKRKSIR
jgi:hypothetical protein